MLGMDKLGFKSQVCPVTKHGQISSMHNDNDETVCKVLSKMADVVSAKKNTSVYILKCLRNYCIKVVSGKLGKFCKLSILSFDHLADGLSVN